MNFSECLFLLAVITSAAHANDALDAVSFMEGRWRFVSTFFENGVRGTPQEPKEAVTERTLGDAFIRMNLPVTFPGATFQFEMTLSYDRFNQVYRLAVLDDLNGFMDMYSGQMKNGVLTMTNVETGTAFPDGKGGLVFGKLELHKTADGFQLHGFVSSAPEGPFENYMKMAFTAEPTAK